MKTLEKPCLTTPEREARLTDLVSAAKRCLTIALEQRSMSRANDAASFDPKTNEEAVLTRGPAERTAYMSGAAAALFAWSDQRQVSMLVDVDVESLMSTQQSVRVQRWDKGPSRCPWQKVDGCL